jgi:FKBP-type peptidyl-prolyl cis-trans isomerase
MSGSRFILLFLVFSLCLLLTTGCKKEPNKKNAKPQEEQSEEDDTGDRDEPTHQVKIEDLKIGKGPAAKELETVVVHYTGKLEDGTVFESSWEKEEPYKFVLGTGNVIQGWHLGIKGMKEGGKRRLTIPPELGYGENGKGETIPPNATLIFDIELLKIQRAD